MAATAAMQVQMVIRICRLAESGGREEGRDERPREEREREGERQVYARPVCSCGPPDGE